MPWSEAWNSAAAAAAAACAACGLPGAPYMVAAAAACAACSALAECARPRLFSASASSAARRFLPLGPSTARDLAAPWEAAFWAFFAAEASRALCFAAEASAPLAALPLRPAASSAGAASAAASASKPRARASSTLRLRVEFQWFLIALSVRPTKVLAISAHLLPNLRCARINARSSSRLHSSRLMSGLRWLYQRSRHCLPMRPGSCCAIFDHCFAPSAATSSMIFASSSFVHGPFTSSGLSTFCQRWRHCTSVRSSKYSAARFKSKPTTGGVAGEGQRVRGRKGETREEGARRGGHENGRAERGEGSAMRSRGRAARTGRSLGIVARHDLAVDRRGRWCR